MLLSDASDNVPHSSIHKAREFRFLQWRGDVLHLDANTEDFYHCFVRPFLGIMSLEGLAYQFKPVATFDGHCRDAVVLRGASDVPFYARVRQAFDAQLAANFTATGTAQ